MCFSSTADFAAAAGVGAVGVATLLGVRRPPMAALGAVPLLFALHQATEGVVWLGMDGRVSVETTRAATTAFMVFAQALLPPYLAAAVWLAEPEPRRRRAIALAAAAGAAVCAYGLWGLLVAPSTVAVEGRCLAFRNPVTNHPWYALAYAAPALAPLFSSRRWVRVFGALNIGGMAAVLAVRAYALTSVWCLYAAVLSVLLYMAVRREESAPHASEPALPQPRSAPTPS